jgi:hypothetical protein
MFGRKIKIALPQISYNDKPNIDIRQADADSKTKMKNYADRRRNAKESYIEIGDSVLLKKEGKGKSDPPFDPEPFLVTQRLGSMITPKRNGRTVTRNTSFFKTSPETVNERDEADDSDGEECMPRIPNRDIPAQPVPRPELAQARNARPQRERRRPARLNEFVLSVKK